MSVAPGPRPRRRARDPAVRGVTGRRRPPNRQKVSRTGAAIGAAEAGHGCVEPGPGKQRLHERELIPAGVGHRQYRRGGVGEAFDVPVRRPTPPKVPRHARPVAAAAAGEKPPATRKSGKLCLAWGNQ